MSYGPSRGRRGGSGRHDPYGRNDRGGSRGGDYEEEVIEISTNRLYVHNLSWRVSWQDLKDHMRGTNQDLNVLHADIMSDTNGVYCRAPRRLPAASPHPTVARGRLRPARVR